MKIPHLPIAATILVSYALASCGGHDHDHAAGDHDHSAETADHAGGDHDADHGSAGETHDGDHGHDHDKIVAGPNGGRILHEVEPHAEFFVTDERRVQITFVDDALKPIPAADQTVSAMAGDRAAPTKLVFVPSGGSLLSDHPLPEGNDFPIVVSFRTSPEAETVRAKFNVNLEECPTCDNKEYACTCDHDHGDDHGAAGAE